MTMGICQRMLAGSLLLLLPGSCLIPAEPPLGRQPAAAVAATPSLPPAPMAVLTAAEPDVLTDFSLPRSPQQGLVMVARAPAGADRVLLDGVPLTLADDGRFLLAFDRDAPPAARLTAQLSGGRVVKLPLVVGPGNWRIEQINAPYRGSAGNDAEFARRRPAELAQINAARRTGSDSIGWQQNFIWPVRGRLSGFFGSQRVYQGKPGSYHSGLDIAAPPGTPFVAPADGVVVLAASAPFTLEGNLLIVDHGMGMSSAFLHAARLDVVVGQAVRQGERLGSVGATGRATGPHLHWGLRLGAAKLDPLLLLPR
jgi:murein DD-endopeptidase MepM/ murein hydrolase activator NlpD